MSIQEKMGPAEMSERPLREYTVHEIPVSDTFETGEHARITTSLRELEAMGFYGDTDITRALQRKRKSDIDYNNPATKALIERVPGVEHWLALVPTTRALSPLYDPSGETLPGGHVIGDELRTWMIEIADARGLRHRSQMVTELLTDEVVADFSEGAPKWLSIAAGAAQPILRAADRIKQEVGVAPDMTLVDLSSKALADARVLAHDLGVDEALHIERMNVLRRQGLHVPAQLGQIALIQMFDHGDRGKLSREKLETEKYDVVEAVGILEYMKPEDWPYTYNKVTRLKTKQSGALRFLKNSYRLVKPGGDLIVGNMLDSHPQLGFTLNTIQWPHIQPRSIEEMMKLFEDAGIEGETHVYVPSDEANQVYALYRIHKPKLEGE